MLDNIPRKPLAIICIIGFFAALAIAFVYMRAVMIAGGACAEGSPFAITVPCPKGSFLMPLSIIIGLILFFIYGALVKEGETDFRILLYSAVFLSLGWNFFDFAYHAHSGDWLTCGILFAVFGFIPLYWTGLSGLKIAFTGSSASESTSKVTTKTPHYVMIALHVIAIPIGIYSGLIIYKYFSV